MPSRIFSFPLASAIALFLLGTLTLSAQDTGDDTAVEYPDSTYYPADSSYYEDPTVDTAYVDYGDGGDGEMIEAPASFGPGGGLFFGPTFEVTALSPSKLDPQLDGDLVLYGAQVYVIISGWSIGGHWTSATLYDISTNYDQFEFSYGGGMLGYDVNLPAGFSFRLGTLIGGGDLNMVKKRPDLGVIDSTDNEILERYRNESFFLLRPGASLGFAPLPFLDLRAAVDFLYPIGGNRVHDLKELTYGLHVMFGFGR